MHIITLLSASVCLLTAVTSGSDAESGSCYLSKAWCTQAVDIPALSRVQSTKWGAYRPGTYFGMKSRTDGLPIGTGIMWSSSIDQAKSFRDQTADNELERFEWTRHDGKHFGTEELVDTAYGMRISASFVVPGNATPADTGDRLASAKAPTWFQKIHIEKTNTESTEAPEGSSPVMDRKSLVFYMGADCSNTNFAECVALGKVSNWKAVNHRGSAERGFDHAVSVVGQSDTLGWFTLFFIIKQEGTADDAENGRKPSVSFVGLKDTHLLSGVERIKNAAKTYAAAGDEANRPGSSRRHKRTQPQETPLFDEFGDFNNEIEDDASFVAVHVGFSSNLRMDALLYTDLTVASENELSGLIEAAERQGLPNVLPFPLLHLSTDLVTSFGAVAPITIPSGTSTIEVDADGSSTIPKLGAAPSSKEVTVPASSKKELGAATSAAGKALVAAECNNRGDCIRKEVDDLLAHYTSTFDAHFNEVFDFTAASADVPAADEGTSTAMVAPEFTAGEIEAAKVCLSSVLGGFGYFQGVPSIGVATDVDSESADRSVNKFRTSNELVKAQSLKPSTISLFTASPSRTAFPRGFLWDEGFHQMLISQWSPSLTMEVIASWLKAMHFPCGEEVDTSCVGGWIPREMILGEEARRRVPDEFIVQRVNIANPPTFLLVVDNLLTRFASPEPQTSNPSTKKKSSRALQKTTTDLAVVSEELEVVENNDEAMVKKRDRAGGHRELVAVEYDTERALVLDFLRDIYPLLHRWVQWYLHTQRGSDTYLGSFRWRGRSSGDGKVIPNTLASGLDDYPRAPIPSPEEHHVDLHCWMTKAAAIMARLEEVLATSGHALPLASAALAAKAQYQNLHDFLLQRLDELHWSAAHKGFFDVGVNNEDASFLQQIVFRCSNPRDSSTTDVAVPVEDLQKGRKDFCPTTHPKPLFPLGDGQGNYKIIERLVMENPTLSHIPRVGYVSIFPLLLKLLDPYSLKLGALLDMVEDPRQLWTDHGLRSIALTDKFYQRRNSEGDAPYWR